MKYLCLLLFFLTRHLSEIITHGDESVCLPLFLCTSRGQRKYRALQWEGAGLAQGMERGPGDWGRSKEDMGVRSCRLLKQGPGTIEP